ncbi:MAG: hypothetical protein KJZ74_04135 [Gemmatimonadales bacterium]|nr:hypothetical protein [Gemmatimonadota bacterium]MCL4213079.1 hypothetical protein [Gemmatimonadales bacterium]
MNRHRVPLLVALGLVLASASVAPASAQGTAVLPIADAKARRAVEREIASAEAKGLPTQPLVAKAMEGVAKQATGERIRVAVAEQAKRLEQARILLAPSPSVAELTSGADALAVGVPGPMLKQIRAAWPATQSVVMPLDVLTELVARNVPAKHALEQITQLMARGATPSQIASIGASVQSDVAAGLAPDAALEVRARGVMSLLPSPAAAAALAPSGRRP